MGLSPHLYVLYGSAPLSLSISSDVHRGHRLQPHTALSSQENEPVWIH